MRELADSSRIGSFMSALAAAATTPAQIYLTGGSSAVLLGWRTATIDVGLKLVPDSDELLKAIPALKQSLQINVELAAPDQFIPEVPGWQDRSLFILQERTVSFFHYDFYSQALAKIERGHATDLEDSRQMLANGLVEKSKLIELFEAIEPRLFRYPAINPATFRRAVEAFVGA